VLNSKLESRIPEAAMARFLAAEREFGQRKD
jgi:hypothetical protein